MEICRGWRGPPPLPEVPGEGAEWRPLQCTCQGGGAVAPGGGARLGASRPRGNEKSELPVACREAGKVSGELASEPGAPARQLVSELALALFPSQNYEPRARGRAVSFQVSPSVSIGGKNDPQWRWKACCGHSCWSMWLGAGVRWESWVSLAGAGVPPLFGTQCRDMEEAGTGLWSSSHGGAGTGPVPGT